MSNELLSLACFIWFMLCWAGYAKFARNRAKQTHCIASVLQRHRHTWMKRLLYREHIIADTALLASLERQVSLLASTSVLILAGLLTLLGTSEQLHQTLIALPTLYPLTLLDVQIRLILMIAIFIYAFFTFTWSVRQYMFCSVLMGAFPQAEAGSEPTEQHQTYMKNFAKIIDHAGHSYNYGLRSFYFAMSTLLWFFHPAAFIVAAALVMFILYRREFHSRTLKVMNLIEE